MLCTPPATLNPVWPCTLSGCKAKEFCEPPIMALPPRPTTIAALASTPA